MRWSEDRGLELSTIKSYHVSAYLEELGRTKLYDRRDDELTLDEVERISI